MIAISEGDCDIGSDFHFTLFETSTIQPNEMPRHKLSISDFEICERPVTQGEYLQFMEGGGYGDETLWNSEGWEWRKNNLIYKPLCFSSSPTLDLLSDQQYRPAYGVSLYEASAYCQWVARLTGVGYRLPMEEEWEKAASWNPGTKEKRVFPWGNKWRPSGLPFPCHALNNHPPLPVCFYGGENGRGDNRSFYGCFDMVGNIYEWTSSQCVNYPKEKNPNISSTEFVLKGGNYINDDFGYPTTTQRKCVEKGFRGDLRWTYVGFRLALDVKKNKE